MLRTLQQLFKSTFWGSVLLHLLPPLLCIFLFVPAMKATTSEPLALLFPLPGNSLLFLTSTRHLPVPLQVPLGHLLWKTLCLPPSAPLQGWHPCPQLLRALALRAYSCFLPWECFSVTEGTLPKFMPPARASPQPMLTEEGGKKMQPRCWSVASFCTHL